MINVVSSSRYRINRKKIKNFTRNLLLEKGFGDNNLVNIAFVGKIKMKKVSNTYKSENVALPVLTFLYNEKQQDKNMLGEIVICYPQAVLLAAHRNKRVDDVINQLVEHGVKNLVGNT